MEDVRGYVDALFQSAADGPFYVFECGLAPHRAEIVAFLEGDVHFQKVLLATLRVFGAYSPEEQRAHFDLIAVTIHNYVLKNPEVPWGYYLYILLCFRTRRVERARSYIEHVGRTHMIQTNDGLLFQYLIFVLLDTGDFQTCRRNLELRNADDRWDDALCQLIHYESQPQQLFQLFQKSVPVQHRRKKLSWAARTACAIV